MVAQKIVFVACLFISALCFVTADEEAEVGIVIVKVLGRSGKIAVRQKSQNETSAIVITMESLEELDSNNKPVGNGGKRKHTFRNFANQDFVFSSARNSTYQGLKVLTFSSKGYLVGPEANFTVVYYIFQENGTINVGDNETANVYVGTLKWTIQIENWQFCGGPKGDNCSKGGKAEFGEKLSFTISVKSRMPPKKRARQSTKDPKGKRKLEEYDIGDASLELSAQVKTDGAWMQMADGFPLYESKGNKQQFTFRFPKFENTTFYDPNMSVGSQTSGGESGDTTPTSTTQGSAASHTYPLSYAFLAIAMVLGAFTDMFY